MYSRNICTKIFIATVYFCCCYLIWIKFPKSDYVIKIYISDGDLGSDTMFKYSGYRVHLASYMLLKE